MGSKRRRLALSCVDCRRRKVKCDRTYPSCIRCQKAGNSDNCTYVSYDERQSSLPTPTEDSPDLRRRDSNTTWQDDAENWEKQSALKHKQQLADRTPTAAQSATKARPQSKTIQELEERVGELESHLQQPGQRPFSTDRYLGGTISLNPARSTDRSHKHSEPCVDQMQLRGKCFRTQYYGPSAATSLLLTFESLSKFTKEILVHLPNRGPVREVFKKIRASRQQDIAAVSPLDTPTLTALVPSRQRCDSLVQEYLTIFENTYRVLHVPSFMHQYEAFWTSPRHTTVVFLIQLLAILSTVNIVTPGIPKRFIGRSTEARDDAIRWVNTVESWLDAQSQKHTTMEIFQIRILLLFAKQINSIKQKRMWTEAGHLLRHAMAAGFHREPSLLSQKISVFHQEMRRRLWFTVVELDAMIACGRGMTATISARDWDVRPPLNIDDESFDDDTNFLPEPKPLSKYTSTSFLCFAEKSLPLRIELLSQINSIRPSLGLEDSIAYDDRIRQLIDQTPDWEDDKSTLTARMLSKLLMYEYLLLIHQTVATEQEHSARHFYSRTVRRDAAFKTLNIYASLPPDLSVMFSSLRDEALRSALAASHDIVVSEYTKENLSQDTRFAVELIDKTVILLKERVRALGEGFYQFWVCASALSLVQSITAPELPVSVHISRAVERVKILNDAMAAQMRLDGAEQQTSPSSLSLFPSTAGGGAGASNNFYMTTTPASSSAIGPSFGNPPTNLTTTGIVTNTNTPNPNINEPSSSSSQMLQPQQQQQQQQQQPPSDFIVPDAVIAAAQTFNFDNLAPLDPFDPSLFDFNMADPWSLEGITGFISG